MQPNVIQNAPWYASNNTINRDLIEHQIYKRGYQGKKHELSLKEQISSQHFCKNSAEISITESGCKIQENDNSNLKIYNLYELLTYKII